MLFCPARSGGPRLQRTGHTSRVHAGSQDNVACARHGDAHFLQHEHRHRPATEREHLQLGPHLARVEIQDRSQLTPSKVVRLLAQLRSLGCRLQRHTIHLEIPGQGIGHACEPLRSTAAINAGEAIENCQTVDLRDSRHAKPNDSIRDVSRKEPRPILGDRRGAGRR